MDFPALLWEEFGKQNDSRDVQGSGVETDLFFFLLSIHMFVAQQIRVRKNSMIENDPVQTSWYINSTRSDLLLLIQMPCQM